MRLAEPREAEEIILRLSIELDDEIPDRDTAIDVLDNWFEWLAGYRGEQKVQLAYSPGDPVGEWGGLPAGELLAYVTPASLLNTIFTSEFDSANLALTPDGAFVLMSEPDDQAG